MERDLDKFLKLISQYLMHNLRSSPVAVVSVLVANFYNALHFECLNLLRGSAIRRIFVVFLSLFRHMPGQSLGIENTVHSSKQCHWTAARVGHVVMFM